MEEPSYGSFKPCADKRLKTYLKYHTFTHTYLLHSITNAYNHFFSYQALSYEVPSEALQCR
ncbi:hypothetical protein BC943DRAFT_15085 [Umbelopsis sp. AD052]|nr:hypothetical protein BC943DRAFT_15085 [Umbelopsis sp. AD052]